MSTSEAPIDPTRELGNLVAETPAFARVFESVGIDYCCGGGQSLADACDEQGIDLEALRTELRSVRSDEEKTEEWGSMTALIENIISEHHDYLREELPSLEALVSKVARVHGDSHPELTTVEEEFSELTAEMREHTDEEEMDVFPIVEKLDTGTPLTESERSKLLEAFADLEDDHEAVATRLERIAELTDGYAVPSDACGSYRNMMERLETLERETHMHVHKENNVLFPEAERHLSIRFEPSRVHSS